MLELEGFARGAVSSGTLNRRAPPLRMKRFGFKHYKIYFCENQLPDG